MGIGPSQESYLVEWLLRKPIFHRFVGNLHTRFRHIRHGKTQEEMMEEMGGTNYKERRAQERFQLLRHFREEVGNQMRELGGGQSRSKGGGGGSNGGQHDLMDYNGRLRNRNGQDGKR